MWSTDSSSSAAAMASLASAITPSRHPGTERRQAESLSSHWLSLVLEELDYGVVLLNASGRVLHCNLAARRSLDEEHPLLLSGNLSLIHI